MHRLSYLYTGPTGAQNHRSWLLPVKPLAVQHRRLTFDGRYTSAWAPPPEFHRRGYREAKASQSCLCCRRGSNPLLPAAPNTLWGPSDPGSSAVGSGGSQNEDPAGWGRSRTASRPASCPAGSGHCEGAPASGRCPPGWGPSPRRRKLCWRMKWWRWMLRWWWGWCGWSVPQELAKPRFGPTVVISVRDTWMRFPTRWLPNVPDSESPSELELVEGAGNGLQPTRLPKPEERPMEDGGSSTLDAVVRFVSGLTWRKLWW